MSKYFYVVGFLFVIFLISCLGYNFNIKGQSNSPIFTPADKPYNKTFAQWAAAWWNYHLGIKDIKSNSSLSHPRDAYSPEKCSWNQNNGPVWFLPDGKDRSDITNPEIRNCTVPQGKALLVQVIGSGCSTAEGYTTEKEILDCAIWVLPQASFSASIDGVNVIDTNKNPSDRQKCFVDPFRTNLTYTDNNLYHRKAGTYPGMVAGCYLFVKPLKAGMTHEVDFKETAIKFSNGLPVDKRLSNVKYLINVK